MTSTRAGTLVLKDQAGSYFLVSQETLAQGRVPEQQRGELERLTADTAQGGGAGDDVQGHLFGAVFWVGFAIGYGVTKAVIDGGESGGGATTAALGHKALATANDLNAQHGR